MIQCFADHPGQPTETPKDGGGRKKKGGGKTEPPFIRCVVPNTHKQPGGVEPGLVMHQYQCNGVLDVIALDKEKFRLGHTKVFFRAGILGLMEEFREDRIGQVLAWLQSGARGKASRMQFKKLQDQKLALYCCQRTIRNYYIGKTWLWWHIWTAIKPNLKCTQFGKYKQEYEEKIATAEANIDKAIADREKVQAVYD